MTRALSLTLLAALAVGCGSLTAPYRTLPERIETVYIPMPRNDTYEYGFEEDLAHRLHEEFLADGRLRPTHEAIADSRLEVTVARFSRAHEAFNDDDYPLTDLANITANLNLQEPGRDEPTVEADASAQAFILSDPRRSQYTPEAEWRQDLLQNLARNIVQEVLTHRAEEPETDWAEVLGIQDLDAPDLDEDQDVPSIRTSPARGRGHSPVP